MKVEYLIADPSFFTRKDGLRKLAKLENQIIEYELSETSAYKIKPKKLKVVTSSGGTQTISSTGFGGRGRQPGLTYEEREKHSPIIVLPSVFKALDDLLRHKIQEEEVIHNQELKKVFNGWGVKPSDFESRIKDLQKDKMFIEFFGRKDSKIKYATAAEFKYNPKKIGENSILLDEFVRILGKVKGKVNFEMLATCKKLSPRAVIGTCSKRFLKNTSKLGIVRFSLTMSGPTAYFFNIGQTLTEYAPTISDYIDPVLTDPLIVIAKPVIIYSAHGIQYMRKLRSKEELNKDKKETEEHRKNIDADCRKNGSIIQCFPQSPYQ